MELREKECRKCSQCNEFHLDKKEICPSCNEPTVKALYYSRLRLERFALIYTLSLIICISLYFGMMWRNVMMGPIKDVFMVVFWFLVAFPMLLMGVYHVVNEFLSGIGNTKEKNRKELSIYREIYFQNNKPAEEDLPFSWFKYFKEALSFVGTLLIFSFLGAGILLFKNLLN